MTLLTEQSIRDTESSYADHDNGASAFDELEARTIEAMHLVREARLCILAAMMATATPKNTSPFADLAVADAKLAMALTIFD